MLSCEALPNLKIKLLRSDQPDLEKPEGQRSPEVQKADSEAWPGVTRSAVQGRNKGLDSLRR